MLNVARAITIWKYFKINERVCVCVCIYVYCSSTLLVHCDSIQDIWCSFDRGRAEIIHCFHMNANYERERERERGKQK